MRTHEIKLSVTCLDNSWEQVNWGVIFPFYFEGFYEPKEVNVCNRSQTKAEKIQNNLVIIINFSLFSCNFHFKMVSAKLRAQ